MIESLIKPEVLEHKSYEMLFLAMAIGAISFILASMISKGSEAAHLMIAFCCIGMAPIMVRVITMEEQKDESEKMGPFFGGYWAIIQTYAYYFIGIIIIVSMIFTILPEERAVQAFSAQVEELNWIRGGQARAGAGGAGHVAGTFNQKKFVYLLENNMGVLALALLFSFIFGAGAIYIITWNASIIGVLTGITAKVGCTGGGALIRPEIALSPCAVQGVNNILVSYLIALPCSMLSLLPHGIFEISAYFLAGLAGGILSTVSVSNRLPSKKVMEHTMAIIVLSMIFIVIGAVIESFY